MWCRGPGRGGLARFACLAGLIACGDPPEPTQRAPARWDRPDVRAVQDAPAPADTPARIEVATEVSPDVPVEVTPVAVCPGAGGCACSADAECASKTCLDDGATWACAPTCGPDGQCAPGLSCAARPGTTAQACVVRTFRLCNPCTQSSECVGPGAADATCVDHGPIGWFCGVACAADADCPTDFACLERPTTEGDVRPQCVPLPGPADPVTQLLGICPCSPFAVARALTTPCQNDGGKLGGASCIGQRQCTLAGLSACDAPAPASETCNGFDDDCDDQTDEGLCADADPCTADACGSGPGGCTHQTLPNGSVCNDGDKCTENDICLQQKCAPGAMKGCSDGNSCTVDACVPATGCTATVLDSVACVAGANLCSVGAVCAQGMCKAGAQVACDDGAPCTADACDPDTGKCGHVALVGAATCNDGNVCTQADVCVGGTCTGAGTACSDGKACTWDACHPKQGCVHVAATGPPCDDGNACTWGDACSGGVCLAAAPKVCPAGPACTVAQCQAPAGTCTSKLATDGAACEDSDACTQGGACAGGLCKGASVGCGDGNPCTLDLCEAATGCVHVATAAPCDDGAGCTEGDTCQGGACVPETAKACNDGNACTIDSCSGLAGVCGHAAGAGPCSDGNPCTLADACTATACRGTPLTCNDGNPCTQDACGAAGACIALANGDPCNDGNACTTHDACKAKVCAPGLPVDCGDGEPCTVDSCQADGSCAHVAQLGPCDDANPCTPNDACQGGKCVGATNACNCKGDGDCAKFEDGDACNGTLVCSGTKCTLDPTTVVACPTSDGCMVASCAFATGKCAATPAPDGGPCSDGKLCTNGDKCKGGVCLGVAAVCSDGDPCTADSCAADAGCVHSATDAAPCDDGSWCTVGEVCAAGICVGANVVCDDGNTCTADGCAAASGCVTAAVAGACDDGNPCTANDKCAGGVCVAGGPALCNDGEACTLDGCSPKLGCTAQPMVPGAPCSDGSACTSGEVCGPTATCGGGVAKTCIDGKPCTLDLCAVGSGACSFPEAPTGTACDDGNPCTVPDACPGLGAPCHGAALACSDGDPCTLDLCGKVGCMQTAGPAGVPCNDGNLCTVGDTCGAAGCAGVAAPCDDKQLCTLDGCIPPAGCLHVAVAVGLACDDGDVCTNGDACAGGSCQGAPTCSDGNACTKDQCAFGDCFYVPLPAASTCSTAACAGTCALPGKCVPTTGCGP